MLLICRAPPVATSTALCPACRRLTRASGQCYGAKRDIGPRYAHHLLRACPLLTPCSRPRCPSTWLTLEMPRVSPVSWLADRFMIRSAVSDDRSDGITPGTVYDVRRVKHRNRGYLGWSLVNGSIGLLPPPSDSDALLPLLPHP